MEDLISRIKIKHPKLYIVSVVDDSLTFKPEDDEGSIEYKRTLSGCTKERAIKYSTQMKWRITQSRRECATYFIGIDDDGSIIGLSDSDILNCIDQFVKIAKMIQASIRDVKLISIRDHHIICINVKIKRIKKLVDNFLVDFS